MTNKTILPLVFCLMLSSIVMPGCGQMPTSEPTSEATETVEATSSFDPPTPLPSPTATVAPADAPTPVQSDQPVTGEPRQSGIQGHVLRGPMCGGPVSADNPCPDQPFGALFYVLDSQGNQVAHFSTDEQGYFWIPLLPGTYTIVPDKSAPLMSPSDQKKKVTVQVGELVQVTLTFDTGIR